MSSERKTFKMTKEDQDILFEAFKPRPLIATHCGHVDLNQRANEAWATLGKKMGFEWATVEPAGMDSLVFTAIPQESPVVPRVASVPALLKILTRLQMTTRNTLDSHPETACCCETRAACDEALALITELEQQAEQNRYRINALTKTEGL